MREVTIEQIDEARAKVLENAKELVAEAGLLFDYKHYARCFTLAHLACEELAKLPMLARTGIELLKGRLVDWRRFHRRMKDHRGKLLNIEVLDLLHAELVALSKGQETDLKACVASFRKGVAVLGLQNDLKNLSLYVGFCRGQVTQPTEVLRERFAESMLHLARGRLRFLVEVEGHIGKRLESVAASIPNEALGNRPLRQSG